MTAPRILIVDDEPHIRFIWERSLSREGYLLDEAADGAEALQKLGQHNFDVILLELQMEHVNGMEVLKHVLELDADMVVIILTAHSSVESAVEALRLGAFDYLFKPATPESVRERVRQGLQQRRHALRRRQLLAQIEGLRLALDNLDLEAEQAGRPPPTSDLSAPAHWSSTATTAPPPWLTGCWI
jgi:DNA-binding NtrC family response regulator